MLVALLVTVMLTPETAAPLWSRMGPTRLPESNWACAIQPTKNSAMAKERVRKARLVMLLIGLTIGTSGQRMFKGMRMPDEYERQMKGLRSAEYNVCSFKRSCRSAHATTRLR